jgi:hypothetical protein
MSPSKIQNHVQQTFKPNILRFPITSSPYGFREQKEGLIRPKPIHKNLPEKEPVSVFNIDVNKDAETRSCKDDCKQHSNFIMIDSVHHGNDKVWVLRSHQKRIMKRRVARAKETESDIIIPRSKYDGPIHDSRSKFAMKRPRDPNGRFYTQVELEQMRQNNYINCVVEYLTENVCSYYPSE